MDSSLETQFPGCEPLNGCCDRFVISDDSMGDEVNAGAGDGGVGLVFRPGRKTSSTDGQ